MSTPRAGETERLLVTVPGKVLFQDLGGEAVLLSLESGAYYGVNEAGARLWSLLQEHSRFDLILSAMLREYEVPEPVLEADLKAFLADLEAHGLVRIEGRNGG